jgi:8-oxo-dGTP pyrophosphatase MutT (NUDIX family)
MNEAPRRASCVFHAEGKFLFSVAADSMRGEFLIPVGGAVEPGESPEDAVAREVWEEIGVEVEAPKLIGVLEDTFDYEGGVVNGIVFCYLAEAESIRSFPDAAREEDGGEVALEWMSLERLGKERRPVFPAVLLEVLRRTG